MMATTDDRPGSGIRVERFDGVATIWLDNPAKRNAFDLKMLEALMQAAEGLAEDRTTAVVVLRGAGGRAFSAGADFQAFAADDRAAFAERFNRMEQALGRAVRALSALPQPLVAAIEGACFGGAAHLALCADIRCANQSMCLSIPAGSIGIVYPLGAIERLIALAGPGFAKLLLMTGRTVTAEECRRSGLIEVIAPDDRFDLSLNEICIQLMRSSHAASRAYKRIVDGIMRNEDRAALQVVQDTVNASAESWQRLSVAIQARKKK